jgi:putative mRNA 3-end processing factor
VHTDLVTPTPEGLACAAGGFWIDPWKPVPLAVLTHGHGDHARPGSGRYLAAEPALGVLRKRLPDAEIEGVPYGETRRVGAVDVSFHPAGHVLGSAQVRVDDGREVWVVSGDYKRAPDPTCAPFEVVPCDVFVTEATFALPVFRWEPAAAVAAEILAWREVCAAAGRTAVLLAYAFGKAQRILAELAALTDRPAYTHGAVESLTAVYREAGVAMLPTIPVGDTKKGLPGELVIAPPSAAGSPWMKRLAPFETGFASGWMRVRGARRRKSVDRGFVLSDHADWPALLRTVRETGARRVLCTHGFADALARHLRDTGLAAETIPTLWEGEAE